jgi:hemerythrin superfamily protein
MATAPRKTAAGSRGRTTTRSTSPDAIALLKADHQRVTALFEQYAKSRSATKKQAIVTMICQELTVHAMIEEEIFYPAVRAALKDRELVPEALVEHATLKEFIAKVEGRTPDGDMFDAHIQVMGEYVKHHVKEEQTEMFTKARRSKLDLKELGTRLAARKEELKAAPDRLPRQPNAVETLADDPTPA